MALVPAKCTQCGAQIEIDNTQEAGICKHCGTAFITEKAINNYTTYITNNNNFSNANINININNELEQLVSAAKGFEKLEEHSKAQNIYLQITEKYPQDIRGWIGCLYNYKNGKFVKEFPLDLDTNWIEQEPFSRWFKNAYMLADDITKNELINNKEIYINKINKKWNNFKSTLSLSSLKQFIGDDVYSSHTSAHATKTKNGTYLGRKMYVHNNKLYYQSASSAEFSTEFITFEIVEIEENGDIIMNCVYYNQLETLSQLDQTLRIYYYSKDIEPCIGIGSKDNDIIWWLSKSSESKEDILKNSKGCYIATCVYGSYDCPQVWTLRRFRDYTLDKTWYGKVFIKCYYTISPSLVKLFGNKRWFKIFWKKKLDTMVSNLNNKGIENTQYQDYY